MASSRASRSSQIWKIHCRCCLPRHGCYRRIHPPVRFWQWFVHGSKYWAWQAGTGHNFFYIKSTRLQASYDGMSFPNLKQHALNEITKFLKGLVSEQTAIPVTKISPTEGLASYGIDSIGVVRAAQKLSDYLGVPVGAVDIFTATCIFDLAAFSESLILKSQPQLFTTPSDLPKPETEVVSHLTEAPISWRLVVGFLQVLGLFYIAAMLILPAYLATSIFMKFLFIGTGPFNYLIPLAFAPLSWMLYIFLACICISIFGNSFLRLNYALVPEISMWSTDFVKWWTLYKAQEIAGKVLAVHLRGTVFLNYWFGMLGTHVGSAVLLDSVDITDPSLVLIGDGTVIAEGAIIQSHEVKDGVLRFQPVRIGQKVAVGPYSVVQKGSVLGD